MNKLGQIRKKMIVLFIGTMSITLASCGGGGGGEAASPSNVTGNGNPEQKLEDLYIDQTNELTAMAELNVLVQMKSARSFLSICPEPAGGIDVNNLNYDSCIIRAPLDDNPTAFKLMLPNHIDKLVAIVWFYQAGKQPLVAEWQRSTAAGSALDNIWQIGETG
jgi:hypothetical protein